MIEHERRLAELLPAAEIHLSGSTSLPGPDSDDADARRGTLGDKHHRLAWHLLVERPDLLERVVTLL
ncbi:MAG TPA: hypothetical protein VKB70_04440 [Gaiellaceae bacterium]|nr:hypothetical protein [Gaiellaceae bacterium]